MKVITITQVQFSWKICNTHLTVLAVLMTLAREIKLHLSELNAQLPNAIL